MPGWIESQFHVGLVLPAAYPETMTGGGAVLDALVRTAADDFFGAVELGAIADAGVRREARGILDASHLDVVFAAQPAILGERLNLNADDDGERQRAVEGCCRQIDQAYELGARMMMVMSGPDPGEAGARERQYRLLGDSLKQLCNYAQERATEYILAITLEPQDREIDKKRLAGPTREATAVIETVKAEYSNVGLTLDLSHQPLLGETISDMIVEGAEYLIHTHCGNCVVQDRNHPAYGDQHPYFGIPGGENDVEQLRLYLEALIYSGYFAKSVPTSMPVLSIEVKPGPGQRPEVVVANGKRVLREAWARLSQDRWAEGRM
jgi:sugar phosphate isomerase/epimerase